MFAAAADQLGIPATSAEAAVEEVLEYLGTFRILLILDNLETVTDSRLREFLLDMPNGSKVLITSRIGPASENPIKLEPLTTEESQNLLKALASIRGVQILKAMDDQALGRLVGKLKGHPLYIKWLVAGVQAGRRPSDLVNDNSLLLDFCMSNVYDKLGPAARRVLQSMQVLKGPRSQGELAFVNEMTAHELQSAVLELMTTNFVSMRRSGDDSLDGSYETGDFASQYLAKHQPVEGNFRRAINSHAEELTQLGQRLQADGRSDKYNSRAINYIRGPQDVPAARLLFDAHRLCSCGRWTKRSTFVMRPKRFLLPTTRRGVSRLSFSRADRTFTRPPPRTSVRSNSRRSRPFSVITMGSSCWTLQMSPTEASMCFKQPRDWTRRAPKLCTRLHGRTFCKGATWRPLTVVLRSRKYRRILRPLTRIWSLPWVQASSASRMTSGRDVLRTQRPSSKRWLTSYCPCGEIKSTKAT